MTTLVLVADTHGQHRRLELPAKGDVFIHAGDITSFAGEENDLLDFNDFLGALPYRHKIVIAGNHDSCFQQDRDHARAVLTNAIYLEDDEVTIDGLKYYGSPWTPEFMNWAFNLPRGRALRRKWELIPEDTDVLITHGPPQGILDQTVFGDRVGCRELLARVHEVKPKVSVFGHIHEARGVVEEGDTKFVNASTAFRVWEPTVVEI